MKLPPYDSYPAIASDNILLRQVLLPDINHILEISFYDAKQATTVDEAIEMQEKIDKDYNDGNSIHWCIINARTNEIVGTCGYYRGLDKGIGELGCVLLPRFRGCGFMTHAMELAIGFGLDNIGLSKITAITTTQNIKAINLLNRLGFIKVADLQDHEIEYELRRK